MAVRTIGTDIKLTGEKEFNAGMKAINSNLKTLRSDMALTSAEFADNADSVEALTAKQKILRDSVDQHREKVNALRQMYEKQVAAYGENSHGADKYKQALNNATVTLLKETAALQRNTAALEQAKAKADGMDKAAEEISEAADDVARSAGKAADSLDDMGDKASKSESKLTGAVRGLKSAASVAAAASAAVLAAGAALGGALLTNLITFANEAAEAAKTASEAGETLTESQQQWLAYANQLEDLSGAAASAKSALAGILLPVLSDLSEEGTAFLNEFSRAMDGAAGDSGKQAKVLSDYIIKGAALIKEKLPEYAKLGKELFRNLGEGLEEAGPEILDAGVDLVLDLLNQIIEFAPELGTAGIMLVEKLAQGIVEQGPQAANSAVELVAALISGIGQAAPDLIPAAVTLVTQLVTALIENAPQLLLAGIELVLGIIQGLFEGIGDLGIAAEELISAFVEIWADRYGAFTGMGGDVVRGIWAGISASTEWIYGKITGWVDDVVAWIKAKLGIESPSTVMRDEVGFWMARGVGTGWQKEMKNVNKLIADSINTSFDVPEISVRSRAYLGRNYATPSGKIVNLYFYAKTITEAEINMIVDVVNRKLGDDL